VHPPRHVERLQTQGVAPGLSKQWVIGQGERQGQASQDSNPQRAFVWAQSRERFIEQCHKTLVDQATFHLRLAEPKRGPCQQLGASNLSSDARCFEEILLRIAILARASQYAAQAHEELAAQHVIRGRES
jgi:hypothetical protein